jgi:hypothetical protein
MSVNDLADTIEDIVLTAALQAKALQPCRFHSEVILNNCNPEFDRRAYAIATNILKERDMMFLREDVLASLKHELETTDDECGQCSHNAGL